jgi:hypothetical protein
LGFVWQLMQIEEKPNNDPKAVAVAIAATTLGLNAAGFFAALNSGEFLGADFILNPTLQANDSRAQTFWGQLPFTTPVESNVLNGAQSSNIIRQWAKLSQWFPATTTAVGNLSTVGIPDLDFSPYAQGFVSSHTYLYQRPFSVVWNAFDTLKSNLK